MHNKKSFFIELDFFSLSRFSFTDTNDSQDSQRRERTFFCSSLPLPPAHEHSHICNWTRTQNHLVLKRTLNHLVKLETLKRVRDMTRTYSHSHIYLQLRTWDHYHVFLTAMLVFTRLLLDEIYHLIELPFDWLNDDAMFVCLLNDLILGFLLQQFDTGNQ